MQSIVNTFSSCDIANIETIFAIALYRYFYSLKRCAIDLIIFKWIYRFVIF